MKNLLVLTLTLFFCSLGLAQAHWDDEFDPATGCVRKINHVYEGPSAPNTLEDRNKLRSSAQLMTSRLTLTPLTPDDRSFLSTLFGNQEVVRFYENGEPWDAERLERRMQRWVNRWDSNPLSWWRISKKEGDSPIGAVGLYCDPETHTLDVACLLLPPEQGQGYMREAFQEGVIPYARPHLIAQECTTICFSIHPDNARSHLLTQHLTGVIPPQEEGDAPAYAQPRKIYTLSFQSLEAFLASR